MTTTTAPAPVVTTIKITAQELRDAASRGEGFYFPAGSKIPTFSEFAAMVGECQHDEIAELDEDDALTNAFRHDIQCTRCAKVIERA